MDEATAKVHQSAMDTDSTSLTQQVQQVTVAPAQTIEFKPQEGPQTAFLESEADIVIYGGARGGGKTYGLLLETLRHVENPEFGAVIFRRTMPRVFQEGGLWDTAERMFPYAGAESIRTNASWSFPWGSTVQFAHLENENDKYAWLGSQIPLLCFDQLEEFSEKQFWFMLASNRSVCGVKPYIRATANPEPNWLADLIAWWWDADTGYPIMERSGVIRWFVRHKDKTHWGDSKEEMRERFPDIEAKSLTFIPAFVDDNKILLETDKSYKANLQAQGTVEQERWLKGNWKIKMSGGMLLRSDWFKKFVPERPARFDRLMRFWDLAATGEKAGKSVNEQPCFTSGSLVGLLDGVWYLCNINAFRKTPPECEDEIKCTASLDPRNTEIRIEKEGGSGGAFTISHFQRFVLPGYDVSEGIDKWQRKAKVERAKVLASAAKAGNVVIVGTPETDWVKEFLADCDLAPDGYMDRIDSISGAMIEMRDSAGGSQTKQVPIPEHQELKVASSRPRGILV